MARVFLNIPPAPIRDPITSPVWTRWFQSLQSLLTNAQGLIPWLSVSKEGSQLAEIESRPHNDLQSIQGGAAGDYYHLTGAQRTDLTDGGDSSLHFHSTDRARANHTGTQLAATISDFDTAADVRVTSGINDHVALADPHTQYALDTNFDSGTYTPTLTNVLNVSASTAYSCQYIKQGTIVTVAGRADVDPTAAGLVLLGISLPFTSNLANANECSGVAASSAVAGQSAAIRGDVTNDRAELAFIAVDLANRDMYFTFTYRVL